MDLNILFKRNKITDKWKSVLEIIMLWIKKGKKKRTEVPRRKQFFIYFYFFFYFLFYIGV